MISIGVGDQPRAVRTTIPYWTNPPPDQYEAGTLGNFRRKRDHQPTDLLDMRGIESEILLDTQGFQVLQHESAQDDFSNVERIKSVAYKEAEELIRNATGAKKVHCFSHLVRDNRPEVAQELAADPARPDGEGVKPMVPSPAVHIDHSQRGSVQVLHNNMPHEEAAKLLEQSERWAVINLWRPIKPVDRDPLCVCDVRTVAKEDLHEQTVILGKDGFSKVSKGGYFGTVAVTSNPAHRWYYLSKMKPNEALLIKIFDSQYEGTATQGTPHTSFTIPGTEDLPARESIELRCLVFW